MNAHQSESWERSLALLPRLVREERIREAEALLETWIAAEPEVAARDLMRMRLFALDPKRWEARIEAALGEYGAAPLAAHRRAMRVLERMEGERSTIGRLESFAAACRERARPTDAEEDGAGADGAGAGTPFERLQVWLDGMRLWHGTWRLAAAKRCVARLEALDEEHGQERVMDPRSARVLARLEAWQEAWAV
ncbi:MAG: hypothetical protein H7834_11935 [Magnetococcus sp. YQC-9]